MSQNNKINVNIFHFLLVTMESKQKVKPPPPSKMNFFQVQDTGHAFYGNKKIMNLYMEKSTEKSQIPL